MLQPLGFIWCRGTELNRPHEDFQSKIFYIKINILCYPVSPEQGDTGFKHPSPPQASSLSSLSSPSSLRKNMLLDIKERMKRIPFFPLLWFVLTFFPFSALTWTGSVVSVSDGDTITPPSGHMIKAAHRAALYV